MKKKKRLCRARACAVEQRPPVVIRTRSQEKNKKKKKELSNKDREEGETPVLLQLQTKCDRVGASINTEQKFYESERSDRSIVFSLTLFLSVFFSFRSIAP